VILNQAGAASLGPGTPAPAEYRLNLTVNYRLDAFQANLAYRHWSKLRPSSNPTLVYTDADIPAIDYFDLNLSYDVALAGHSGTVFLSINNLFDKDPPLADETYGFYSELYTARGRVFHVELRKKF
jgi:outer membrane receptor protein involved in Fe transport